MSLIVFYFQHSTSVLSFYIDEVLTLSITHNLTWANAFNSLHTQFRNNIKFIFIFIFYFFSTCLLNYHLLVRISIDQCIFVLVISFILDVQRVVQQTIKLLYLVLVMISYSHSSFILCCNSILIGQSGKFEQPESTSCGRYSSLGYTIGVSFMS